jgi:hypothetical protein
MNKSAKVVLGREPINLQGVRLASVRYAPITTKLRSAAKCRDGPTSEVAGFHKRSPGELLQQRLGVLQIERVKPLSEPAVNGSKQLASLLQLPIVAPEACHARCGA